MLFYIQIIQEIVLEIPIAQSAGAVEYADCTSPEGVTTLPKRIPVGHHNAWGWDPGGWAVCDQATKKVMWLATLYFGLYWARRAVGEAWSDQLAGHVSPLLNFHKNLNEDNGCTINYAVERLVTLSVPEQVVILGTKTQEQNRIV